MKRMVLHLLVTTITLQLLPLLKRCGIYRPFSPQGTGINYYTYLGRDEWAGTFENYLLERTTPRTDCPTVLPTPPEIKPRSKVAEEHKQPINDLQKGFLAFASALNGGKHDWRHIKTEEEGVRKAIKIKLTVVVCVCTSRDADFLKFQTQTEPIK